MKVYKESIKRWMKVYKESIKRWMKVYEESIKKSINECKNEWVVECIFWHGIQHFNTENNWKNIL